MTLRSKMMPKIALRILAVCFALPLLGLPMAALAQDAPPTAAYSQEQLDQLVAPIALYPDPLIAQVLMASTYPLEIVEATRWLKSSDNIALQGDQLANALQQQPWDPSVKALVNVPQVLAMLDGNLQWTEQLGDAFLGQQAAVMDSVQHLRGMAQSSGNLASTPQQEVAVQQGAIAITPANPSMVYVPYYNPAVVYGTWPYPAYQPYYFPPPADYYYAATGIISFGVGLALIDTFWDWDHWDWRGHRIAIDDQRYAYLNRGRGPQVSGHWEHDPAHRHGVPYTSAGVRSQFQGRADEARRSYRGYAAPQASPNFARTNMVRSDNTVRSDTATRNVQTNARVEEKQRAVQERNVQQQPQTRQRAQAQVREGRNQQAAEMQPRSSAPAFESFSRRADVQRQSARGSSSRASVAPQPAHMETHAAPAAAHSEGGGHVGGGEHGGGGHNER